MNLFAGSVFLVSILFIGVIFECEGESYHKCIETYSVIN